MSWYVFSIVKNLFKKRLNIVLAFAMSTIAPLISEFLQGKTLVTMEILQNCLGTFSSYTSTILLMLIFEEFIFDIWGVIFDVRCVWRKFTTYSCLNLSQKWLLMQFISSVVLERTVRLVTAVYVVLGECNCLPNNKWLSDWVLNMFR